MNNVKYQKMYLHVRSVS